MIRAAALSRVFARVARKALGMAALVGLAVQPLHAQPLPGADTPALQGAITAWLADDEGAALTALADLAREGNASARLLLGLIDTTPALQGPFLAQQPRAARVALMRREGGVSGQNWLSQLDDLPLAQAWRQLRRTDTGPEIAATFAALGESRASRLALITLAAREHPALRAMDPGEVDPALLYLLWRDADPERRARIEAMIPPGDAQWAQMGVTPMRSDVALWLASNPLGAPIAQLCTDLCPDTADDCRIAALEALGSHNALLTLGSPVETLIAQDRFLASPRGRATVLRRILLAAPMGGRRALLSRAAAQSECLAEALHSEARRYRVGRASAPQDG